MGHLMFYLAVVAACLLWSAACIAAAARTDRTWLRRLLVAAAVFLPPLALLPWVGLTGALAFGLKLWPNWFAPTLTAFVAAIVGALWIRAAGLSRQPSGGLVAAAWPVVGLFAMAVVAEAVAFGTLLLIDNAVVAEARMLRVEAAQIMDTVLPPQPLADDDAAPLYLRAFAALEADKDLTAENSPLKNPTAADVGTAEVAAILHRHSGTLDLLRRAADRPGCRFARDWSRPSMDMLLPELTAMRNAARLLALAARREAADGDAAAAIRDVVRMHRIGMHAASEPILISGLVGQAIDSMALDALDDVLPRLEKNDLPLLDEAGFRDFVATPCAYDRFLLGEEAFGLATIAQLALNPEGFTGLSQEGLYALEPKPRFLEAALAFLYRSFLLPAEIAGYRSVLSRYRNLAGGTAGASKPFPEIKSGAAAIEKDVNSGRSGTFAKLMTPALEGVLRSQANSQALHRAAEILVAATRERLETGSLPESPEALVPSGLPAVPRDPFTTDQSLRSKRTVTEWLVYAVGPDGDDDGGPVSPGGEKSPDNDDVGLRIVIPEADSVNDR
jgi:hypothetical protein